MSRQSSAHIKVTLLSIIVAQTISRTDGTSLLLTAVAELSIYDKENSGFSDE